MKKLLIVFALLLMGVFAFSQGSPTQNATVHYRVTSPLYGSVMSVRVLVNITESGVGLGGYVIPLTFDSNNFIYLGAETGDSTYFSGSSTFTATDKDHANGFVTVVDAQTDEAADAGDYFVATICFRAKDLENGNTFGFDTSGSTAPHALSLSTKWTSANGGPVSLGATTSTDSFGVYGKVVVGKCDIDGDGYTDQLLWDTSRHRFVARKSSDGSIFSFYLGDDNSIPCPADYDGDGIDDPAVFQVDTNEWKVAESSNSYTVATKTMGIAYHVNYVPVPGDYDGDGKADLAVYRPNSGRWVIKKSSDGTFLSLYWGNGYIPLVGDIDGDGKADIGFYRQDWSRFCFLKSSNNYSPTNFLNEYLGAGSQYVVLGDYDGDGLTDLGVYTESTGRWAIRKSSTNFDNNFIAGYLGGGSGKIPVPGDYNKDGKCDFCTFDPSTGRWGWKSHVDDTTGGSYIGNSNCIALPY